MNGIATMHTDYWQRLEQGCAASFSNVLLLFLPPEEEDHDKVSEHMEKFNKASHGEPRLQRLK